MIVFILVITNTLLITTISGIKPVVSLYASAIGITPAEISVIVASFAALPMFLAVQIGKWTDKYGIRRMVMAGNVSFLIALLISLVYPNFITFVLQQAIIGIAFTFIVVSLQKRVGSTRGNVEQTIANFSLSGSLGAMIGPILSTSLYEHFGYQISCTVNIFLMLIAFVCGFLISKADWDGPPPAQAREEANPANRQSIWVMLRQRNLRNAIITSGLVLSNRELFSAYFPLLASQMGVSPTMIGFLLSLSGFSMLVVRFSQSALVHKFGRMTVLTWSLYVSGVIYLLMPLTPWVAALCVLVSVLGGGLGLGQPLSLSFSLEVSPPDRRGEVLGLRISVNRISQFSIPLFFGGIGGLIGVAAVFWASGAVLALFGYLTRPLPSEKLQERASEGL